MEVVIAPGPELARLAADTIERVLRARTAEGRHAVLGIATGSSPLAVYDELARRHTEDGLSFAGVQAFMLDEYVGLPAEHPERYRNVIETEFASRVDIDPADVHGPDGLAEDIPAACAAYEAAIAASGGVDVQILGVGTDGHIAFNEPGSSLASRTRIKTLTRQTREDNARFFGGDVTQAVKLHLGAVTLCSYTTIVGYGSLIMADNKALQSFGRLAMIGEIACIYGALFFLPSLLHLLDRYFGKLKMRFQN